jgi:hypothetical protein
MDHVNGHFSLLQSPVITVASIIGIDGSFGLPVSPKSPKLRTSLSESIIALSMINSVTANIAKLPKFGNLAKIRQTDKILVRLNSGILHKTANSQLGKKGDFFELTDPTPQNRQNDSNCGVDLADEIRVEVASGSWHP